MGRGWRVLFLLLLALGLQCHPERHDFADLIRQGDAHFAVREYSFAAQAYRQAASRRPDSPVPLIRLGRTYLSQAWPERAQTALLRAHRFGGWTPELYLLMGDLYLAMGLEAEAMVQWRIALAGDPNLAEARLQLAWAYLRNGAWEEAATCFEDILSRWDPPHRERWLAAHYGLGLLLAPQDPSAALHHLQIAAGSDEGELSRKAILLGADLQQFSPATDAAHAAALLGQAYARVEAWSLARRMLAQAAAAEPDYAEARAYLGHVLDRLGQASRAEGELLEAVRLAPGEFLPRFLLGIYYRRYGRFEEAVLQFREALERDPDNAALHVELGQAWLAQQRYGDAEAALRTAVALAPDRAEFQLVLARFYVDGLIKVRTHGLPAAREATRLEPTNAEAFDLLGWAYYLTGLLEQAEGALRRAVDLNPALASARYHLGAVLQRRGQIDEARYQFWRAIDLDRTGYYRARAMQALDLPLD